MVAIDIICFSGGGNALMKRQRSHMRCKQPG